MDTPPTNVKPSVFLSYAKEDGAKAQQLVDALERNGIAVWHWQDTRRGSTRWIEEIEQRILDADAFVALVSTHFLTSYWCREEWHLALRKEQGLFEAKAGTGFVIVTKLADCEVSANFLGSRNMLDLTSRGYEDVASTLAKQIVDEGAKQKVTDMQVDGKVRTASQDWPRFQNRRAELDELTSAITNPGGRHFWSVVAGPQMGKSWFLERLPRELGDKWNGEPRYVDLRRESSSLYGNGELLLLRLMGMQGDHINEAAYDQILETISESRQPWLLMVDGAEWLEDEAARVFRSFVSRLYRDLVQDGIKGVTLAVVVAGRNRCDPWKGVKPKPEFRKLELTSFEPSIVLDALKDMARIDEREFNRDDWFHENAQRLHRLSEGLPALLIRYMSKLRELRYAQAKRLEREEIFRELAQPYVNQQLLSREALGLPLTQGVAKTSAAQQKILEKALGHLCVFRIFTASHIKQTASRDGEFGSLLFEAGWAERDLRMGLSRTHLLRDSDELWMELDPAIRRLLFRYFHQQPADQLKAHQYAGEFYEGWKIPAGKEQAVMRVEALWHRTETIRLGKVHEGASLVIQYYLGLLDQVPAINGYEGVEVLNYLRDRMMADDELQQSLYEVDANLFDDLHALADQRIAGG